jgi:hypothetical protein
MKSLFRRFSLAALLAFLPQIASAQWMQQTFQLKPGWNAVFLEVAPEPDLCDAQFAGLPVESVWDFNPSVDAPQFAQDPSTLFPGAPGWLTWFPIGHPLASEGNLSILRDGRPYLIKVADAAQPVAWTVTGKPSLRRITWASGVINLVGFHVAPQAPTFQNLFAGETGLAGQPVYVLNAGGAWQPVANLASTRPNAGESYWIRCRLPAQRAGTIEVDPGSRQGVSFPGNFAEQSLRIRNTSAGARNVSVRLLPSATPPAGQPPLAGPVALEYWKTDYANTNLGWAPLSAPVTFTALAAGQEWNLRIGARRSATSVAPPGSQFQSLLEVTDDLGTRWVIPVNADPGSGTTAGFAPAGAGSGSVPQAGLWIGEAVCRAVSQPAHPSDPTLPRPAGGDFTFRLIAHVDGFGTTRLLQHVFLVRKPPVVAPDPENPGFNRVVEPARTVVVTDEALIPSIIGPGEITGRRISSAAFGFKQPVAMTGGSFGSGTLNGAITLGYDDPLNPFKHVFHPDHNNLDERFEQKLPEGKEALTVTRTLSLEFSATDPLGLNPPGWGDSELGGIYREAFSGLHRNVLQVSGTFRLVRVSRVAALNGG